MNDMKVWIDTMKDAIPVTIDKEQQP